MYVRTMPTVNFKKTKKLLAKKNDQDYDSVIAAKHTPHRSLRIRQHQKHQQIVCCALAKTYGRHS